jgi:hypothetical protein
MFEMNETCILKIGNEIGQGVYPSPQNRYRRVLNFQADDKVVSLCAKFLSPGPYRIILDVPDMEEIESFTLRETVLILNGEKSLASIPCICIISPRSLLPIPALVRKAPR